ncbi:MAG: ZIP family metal transporter [Acutalibacteraceae bacterium]
MSILPYVITVTLAAGVFGTGFGGLLGALFKGKSEKTVAVLLNFAAGVMLALVCFDLIPEALENSGLFLVLSGLMLGFASVFLLNDITARFSLLKTLGDTSELAEKRLYLGGIVTAVAIALHNFPEGMVIGAAYAGAVPDLSLDLSRLAVAAAIGLHNIPEGMAMSVPLISGGMKRRTSIVLTALAGAPTVLGAAAGFFLGALSPLWLSLSLSLASGAMLYVVFGELLPESAYLTRSALPACACAAGILTGILIIQA